MGTISLKESLTADDAVMVAARREWRVNLGREGGPRVIVVAREGTDLGRWRTKAR
jgi:hypothetical protein